MPDYQLFQLGATCCEEFWGREDGEAIKG